jgi:hypothetical protein
MLFLFIVVTIACLNVNEGYINRMNKQRITVKRVSTIQEVESETPLSVGVDTCSCKSESFLYYSCWCIVYVCTYLLEFLYLSLGLTANSWNSFFIFSYLITVMILLLCIKQLTAAVVDLTDGAGWLYHIISLLVSYYHCHVINPQCLFWHHSFTVLILFILD